MARAGDPKLNPIEDRLIATMSRGGEGGSYLPEGVEANLRAMLRMFPTNQIDAFVHQVKHALELYYQLLSRTRQRQHEKMRRLQRAAEEMAAAIFDLDAGEYEIVDRIASVVVPSFDEGVMEAEDFSFAKSVASLTTIAEEVMRRNSWVIPNMPADITGAAPPSYGRPGMLAVRLAGLGAAARWIAGLLHGTAQDGTRPLRLFVRSLFEVWLTLKWPQPIWRGDIDSTDPKSPQSAPRPLP